MVKYRHRQFLIEPCAKCFENFEITLPLEKTDTSNQNQLMGNNKYGLNIGVDKI